MSLIKANAVQIGQSPTATQNFTLAVPSSPDGTIKLARGNSGATTQDVMNVSNAGVVSFPQGLGNISNSTAIATGSTTARSLANRFADMVNVKDFGAVGDNITDDTTAIQNAINYATSVSSDIYFPKGTFKTTGINLTCGCSCNSGAVIINPTNATTTVRIPPGNYTGRAFYIPQIAGGLNGLLIDGASLAVIYLTNISNVVNGLHLQVSNSGNTTVDNDIYFNTINNCSGSAIKFSWLTTSLTGVFQGNIIRGNFIITVKYGIHFYDANNGALGPLYWDDTIIDVAAIDNTPTYSGNIGIYGEPNLPPSRFLVKAENFFGGMDRCIVGGSQWSRFYLGFDQANLDYSDFAIAGKGVTIINTAEPFDWNPTFNTQWIPLTTSVNTRSSFNGGITPNRNRFGVSVTIPVGGWTSGTEQTFFAYHAFLTNYLPEIKVEPLFTDSNLSVLWAIENSTTGLGSPSGDTPYPNQIAIRFKAIGNVPAGTYTMFLTVHHTP